MGSTEHEKLAGLALICAECGGQSPPTRPAGAPTWTMTGRRSRSAPPAPSESSAGRVSRPGPGVANAAPTLRHWICVVSPDQNQLKAQLSGSSATFARSALQAQHDDHRVFLLHAATALEHLAKAVLAARHPSLIVATNDFESLLHACGESAVARRPRSKMRTINAADAIARAARFVPTVEALAPDLELLILVRNGVAHLGEASSGRRRRCACSVPEDFRGAPRAALKLDRAAYWGEFVDLVESALKENVEKVRLRVETALAIARQEFEKRFGELDEATRQAMLRVIEAGYAPEKYDEQLLDCPACGTPALTFGSVKVEMDEDWDHHEGVLIGVQPYFTFIPNRLRCSACGLELDGRDELDAAGIAEPWQLEDVDERNFFGGDEDW